MKGDPRQAGCFRFSGYEFDPPSGVAKLSYAIDDQPPLTETLEFPHAPWPPDASRQAAFFHAVELLYLLAGVSYYKAGLAPVIDTGQLQLGPELAAFMQAVYENGLAEMAHVNGLDLAGHIRFPVSDAQQTQATELDLPKRALLAMGGGKDSLVSLEMLRDAGVEILPFCAGSSTLIMNTAKAAGLPLIQVRRTLAPELLAMNERGAWNGHVPVTAINSAIGVCASLLYGFRYVVFSNERSADEATLTDDQGRAVNHQWSKSWAFEQAFRSIVHRQVSPDIEYFSLIRPYSELAVAGRFSELDIYHGVFSSCNRNFHLDGPHMQERWCGDCPKCRFTSLALAVFLSPAAVTEIIGSNLLDDLTQLQGFRALCALAADKPFECVGTAAESRAALANLASSEQWKDFAVVRALAPELKGLDATPVDEFLRAGGPHAIPQHIARATGV